MRPAQSVHLLFYIFEADQTGRRVAEAVARAARRGTRCRVLMDAVGSHRGLRRLGPMLRARGVEVRAMLPVGFFRRNAARFDLRNHRKIAIIDGRVGYTGSQNIVNGEFVRNYSNEELLVRLTGLVVGQLQAVFLVDHYVETGQPLDTSESLPQLEPVGTAPAQVIPSGPGYGRENAQEFIVAMLYGACQQAVITTPLFRP